MQKPIISADSHITEPAGTYVDRIDSKYKDSAPHMVRDDKLGDVFIVKDFPRPVNIGLAAAAGRNPEDLRIGGVKFEEMHRGGWDPNARMADQERDGVAAEVIYPTVGMVLCNHRDFDYKKACFDAYNLWIAEYCATHPRRLIGCGQTAMRSVQEGIADLRKMKELGLRGVMMPGNPQVEDYDSPIYDPFYQAAIDLELPLSFHILTSSQDNFKTRGPKLNSFLSIIRGCQDIMGTFILGGVFERNPKLKLICVEADAGWAPHYMYRMDHAYDRHRYWLPAGALSKMPSEYFRENIYLTFQDDWVAFQMKDMCNIRRLMWANDFPHSDSTWPWSQEILKKHTANLSEQEKNYILHDNVAELYHLSI
ncbi:MAG TPA: amidohydrolase family protein [Candidatus Binataceae bacterium]|nr:amidohydrolase family protein [Candidatus Binataceae bacterium]